MNKKAIITFLLFTLFLSCEKKEVKTSRESEINQDTIYLNGTMSYIFDFPDTVLVDKEYNGRIIYKNILDTITKDLSNHQDSIRNRYMIFTLAKTRDLKNNTESLRKIAIDTFGAVDYRTIPFFKIKFNETGVHFIDGLITDNGYLKLIKKDSLRIITNEFRVAHKVVVIEKP